jgi:hypothetical protein
MENLISKNHLEEIIIASFKKAYQLKDTENFKNDNQRRSSKFVYEVSRHIYDKWFSKCDYTLHLQEVDDSGKKSSGEWLFDMCITSGRTITDDRWRIKSHAPINTEIVFNMESEFSTGLKDLAQDLGKLLASKSNVSLYIQGLNQIVKKYREEFIDNRISILKEQLIDDIQNEFYIAFCPSPVKETNQSLWDTYDMAELLSWIKVFQIKGNL